MASNEVSAAFASWPQDFAAWAEVLFPGVCFPPKVQRHASCWVGDQVRRYGADGMGDKPSDMSAITYWLQHLDGDCGRRVMATLQAYADKKAKAKAKAVPKAEPRRKRNSATAGLDGEAEAAKEE